MAHSSHWAWQIKARINGRGHTFNGQSYADLDATPESVRDSVLAELETKTAGARVTVVSFSMRRL